MTESQTLLNPVPGKVAQAGLPQAVNVCVVRDNEVQANATNVLQEFLGALQEFYEHIGVVVV